jgi:hypothetical protein
MIWRNFIRGIASPSVGLVPDDLIFSDAVGHLHVISVLSCRKVLVLSGMVVLAWFYRNRK